MCVRRLDVPWSEPTRCHIANRNIVAVKKASYNLFNESMYFGRVLLWTPLRA
jgi:hypothetical protein